MLFFCTYYNGPICADQMTRIDKSQEPPLGQSACSIGWQMKKHNERKLFLYQAFHLLKGDGWVQCHFPLNNLDARSFTQNVHSIEDLYIKFHAKLKEVELI